MITMKIDVSEVKTFRECKRKHFYSSRNRYHLVPNVPRDNLIFGTQFHECLHSMYMGTPIETILEWIKNNVPDRILFATMTNMIKGYYEGPYQQDIVDYTVLDIEKSFQYPLITNEETGEVIDVCGSIDMLAVNNTTHMLTGFEHKTAKNFRPEVYDLIDEQPRIYYWAMKKMLNDWHAEGKHLDIVGVDSIILNQCKKLQTKFQYLRSECRYDDEDLEQFMKSFKRSALLIGEGRDSLPEPGYMKCTMCDYADLCMHYGYKEANLNEVLDEFEGEFKVREMDHLEEKTDRIVASSDEKPKQLHIDFETRTIE